MEWRFFKANASREFSFHDLHGEIHSLMDAVEVLREVTAVHSAQPVVVLDEFDRMLDPKERNLFADLVKQLGDKKVPVTFFFTGVGETLSELLGAHPSAIRQFETVNLEKLDWTARWEIARKAADEFGVHIDDAICVRLAAVSDGYPYYVHLITEKLLWRLWEEDEVVSSVEWPQYHAAIRDAIESINGELRRPYEKATRHRGEEYEEVLWAAADSDYLDRHLKDIYTSYGYVMRQLAHRAEHLSYEDFTAVVRKLRSPSCDEILAVSKVHNIQKNGWITYRENLLRGYVRMQAESKGVELLGEREAPKPTIHVSGGRGKSGTYFGPSIPKGVHLGKSRR
ncbi:hypothetical protein A8M77_22970 [Variovorax sp. JS1663]|nr:hypothetical protein A8M77_22970 [Variovorax sp. JS1663]